jgi:hypothetical protein
VTEDLGPSSFGVAGCSPSIEVSLRAALDSFLDQPQPPVAPEKGTPMIKPVAAQPHDTIVVEVEEVK